jgi:DNA-binding transcriptional regulator/RsmH inhibitor MraZ
MSDKKTDKVFRLSIPAKVARDCGLGDMYCMEYLEKMGFELDIEDDWEDYEFVTRKMPSKTKMREIERWIGTATCSWESDEGE